MKVGELIKRLEDFDADREVVCGPEAFATSYVITDVTDAATNEHTRVCIDFGPEVDMPPFDPDEDPY